MVNDFIVFVSGGPYRSFGLSRGVLTCGALTGMYEQIRLVAIHDDKTVKTCE